MAGVIPGLGVFAKLTKPVNAVGSTLKAGASGFKQAWNAGSAEYGRAMKAGLTQNTSTQIGASAAMDRLSAMSNKKLGAMGATAAAGIGGTAAAADFLNPWGLGWGD